MDYLAAKLRANLNLSHLSEQPNENDDSW